LKWEERCREAGEVVHGYDRIDWHAAEGELAAVWANLTVVDMVDFANRVQEFRLHLSSTVIDVRAYFLSKKRPSADPKVNWRDAYIQEWRVFFARFFLNRHHNNGRVNVYNPDGGRVDT
jgi:hypothetical protein